MSLIKMISGKLFPQNIEKKDPPFYKAFTELSHDLKGNLIAIKSCAGNIKQSINPANAEIKINNIERALSGIDKKINHSITLLNMSTLFSSPASSWPSDVSTLSITDCIQKAIQDHPFASDKHAFLINITTPSVDFSFAGNKHLINSVLYCLIKNAVRSFYNRGNSEAIIEFAKNNHENNVYFKFPENIATADSACQYEIFALGSPEKPGNGFNIIAGMLKTMNGDVDFKRQSDGVLVITFTFVTK